MIMTRTLDDWAPPTAQTSRKRLLTYGAALLLATLVTAANLTNYGSLLPAMEPDLHLNDAGFSLFSLFLLAGASLAYVAGRSLASFGTQRVLVAALLLVGLGNCLFRLFPSLEWMWLCRAMIGVGVGAGTVAGLHLVTALGQRSPFALGLFGASLSLGAALGLLLSPHLMLAGWETSFSIWGALALLAALLWSLLPLLPAQRTSLHSTSDSWLHLGTLGVGQALAPWLPSLWESQEVPFEHAVWLAALTLLLGACLCPLGGWLLTRGVARRQIMLVSAALVTAGLSILMAAHSSFLWLAVVGFSLLSVGTTLPFAAAFSWEERGTDGRAGMGSLSLLALGAAAGSVLVGTLLSKGDGLTALLILMLLSLLSLLVPLVLLLVPQPPSLVLLSLDGIAPPEQPRAVPMGRPLSAPLLLQRFVAIFCAAYLISSALGTLLQMYLSALPFILQNAILTGMLVLLLETVVMPLLHHLLYQKGKVKP